MKLQTILVCNCQYKSEKNLRSAFVSLVVTFHFHLLVNGIKLTSINSENCILKRTYFVLGRCCRLGYFTMDLPNLRGLKTVCMDILLSTGVSDHINEGEYCFVCKHCVVHSSFFFPHFIY